MPVLRNVKSINTWSIAEDVPKPAGIVPKPVRLLHNEMTGNMRNSIIVLIVFFIVGLILLSKTGKESDLAKELKKIEFV